jgi:hypothetical protein
MTTYETGLNGVTTVKVTYEDPAGSCAGWFLHSLTQRYPPTFSPPGNFSNSVSKEQDAGRELRASIEARVDKMLGSVGCVRYSIVLIDAITAATVDTDV